MGPVKASPGKDAVVRGLVGVTTKILKAVGGGRSGGDAVVTSDGMDIASVRQGGIDVVSHECVPPDPGDTKEVIRRLKEDYSVRAYFVTGELTEDIYVKDCRFADPTIEFTGLELWKRNLKVLVPFLIGPTIELLDIVVLEEGTDAVGTCIEARWILKTELALPWKPDIYVEGSTLYQLRPPLNNQIETHVESWDIDGVQALGMIFLGSKRVR